MSKQLLKKRYDSLPLSIVFIVTAIMFSTIATAQIVYTDANPDVAVTCTVPSSGSCSTTDSFDINKDGVYDLKLIVGGTSSRGRIGYSRSGYARATPINGSSILSNNSGYPLHLYRNDSINHNSNWSAAANQILESMSQTQNQIGYTTTGNWTPPIDGFLGIKIISGGKTHYGWIRLNVAAGPSKPTVTCKEFAYNSIPNLPILGGQTNDSIAVEKIVYIPDATFKLSLINNAAINTNIDREIQVTEAEAFTGQLYVSGTSISDLTGHEAFNAIDSLYCVGTSLKSLDVTANKALIYLNLNNNNVLTNLVVSGNTALIKLQCNFSQLTSLNLSANTALTYLNCTNNKLTSLDVSNNEALTGLYCGNNQLTNLDVSSNKKLSTLYCNNNQLTRLDFSSNLPFLDCSFNQLTSLDVSTYSAFWYLVCSNNQLTSLNVKNGNNVNFYAFDATFNPKLTCIQVDNAAYSNANWSAYKDASASFSFKCGATASSTIVNPKTIQIFPNPANNHFTIALVGNDKNVEVTIADITGKIMFKTTAIDALEVNTTDFAKGMYVVQIQAAGFMVTKKLIVEK